MCIRDSLKGGQLGYGGHVVNVAHDITTFAATLPRLAADVPIIILRGEGQEPGQHKDLHVGRVRVQRALIWLIASNPYYRDIVLDDTALSQLPVHGQLKFRGYSGRNGRLRRGIEVVCQFLS